MWAAHDVRVRWFGTKRCHHPLAEPMTIHYEAMVLDDPDQRLYVYSVEPDTSADAMARIVALARASSAELEPATS
jgi:MmyB-like transcription regulator ligand binding domain